MSNPTPTYLSSQNAHPRDLNITVEEGPHIYTILGKRGTYKSTTTWLHTHFKQFDSVSIINKILKNKKMKDPTYKYYNMTAESIMQLWDTNRDTAASAGTKLHYDIECFYNRMEIQNNSVEYGYFLEFVKDFGHSFKPYRTEWLIYHEELKISGSIDMVFENSDKTVEIYDWKRAKEIQYEDDFGQSATTTCISHLPDTNFWHYSLQLNMYKRILEEKYGKTVVGLYLVRLHPDDCNKKYERIAVPVLTAEMDDLIELRKKQIN
jgi:hypothetical protein